MAEHELDLEDDKDAHLLHPDARGKSVAEAERLRDNRQDKKAKELISGESTGDHEERGAELARTVRPLHLGTGPKKHGGSELVAYEGVYNMYTTPLRSTLRAMGRIKDLQSAGAVMDPAELQADAKLAAKFKTISFDDDADSNKRGEYNDWRRSQSMLEIAVTSYHAAQHQMQAAIEGFQNAQRLLEGRRKQGELDATKADKAKIDRHAETLSSIVTTSTQALGAMASLEGWLAHGLEPQDTADSIYAPTDDVAAPEGTSATRTRAQKAANMASSMTANLRAIPFSRTTEWINKGGLELKDIFIIAMGDAREYNELTAKIGKLQQELRELAWEREESEIRQAESALKGVQIDIAARKQMVSTERNLARTSAQSFGQAMGGKQGQDAVLAMLTAEAYQELNLFSGQADGQRRAELDPRLGPLTAYVAQYKLQYQAEGWRTDWAHLASNAVAVTNQRDYFEERVPEWRSKAKSWREFLKSVGQTNLIVRDPTKL